MIETIPTREGVPTRLLIRPNRSLSPGHLLLALGLIALLVAVIGLYFFSLGAWLVLPFSGLEILLILFVAIQLNRHAGDYELIEIVQQTLRVAFRRGAHREECVFQLYWLQIQVRVEPGRAGGPQRVYLRSHGRECEVGGNLCEVDRLELAGRLRRLANKD